MLYAKLAPLQLEIDDYTLEPLSLRTATGWTRHSTVVHLRGGGLEGVGEDVTYEAPNQIEFQDQGAVLPLAGRSTLEEFSHRLDELDLFPDEPVTPGSVLFRRWAFESAALDLALRQANTSLAGVLKREPRPVTFAVSLGLGDPPSLAPLRRVLEQYPAARFKVDLAESWTEPFVAELSRTGVVDVVDLKGHYRGAFRGPAANAEQYQWLAEHLPSAWLEDPELNAATEPVLRPFRDRITWDAVLHSVADLVQLPFTPRCVNVKPSRFGFLAELLRFYDYCESRGIAMYGGGQFELGPGRGQIQRLASLFHPGAANDVAPSGFNADELDAGLPTSPLQPEVYGEVGFGWAG